MKYSFVIYILSLAPIALAQTNINCEDKNCMTLDENLCWLKDHILNISKLDKNDELLNLFYDYRFKGGSSDLKGENIPWGAYYFPYKKGGITQRWKKLTDQYYNAAIESELNWDRYKKMSSK